MFENNPSKLDPEVFTPLPIRHHQSDIGDPLAGFGSPTEFHQYITTKRWSLASASNLCPFRGFFPYSVFPSRRATYPRQIPTCRLRCALRVSHPLDALLPSRPTGLVPSQIRSWGSPFEAFILPRCRTPSRTPRPSGLTFIAANGKAPYRDSHTTEDPAPELGFSQPPDPRASLGLPASRPLAHDRWQYRQTNYRPLTCFSDPAAS
jgi:hypothetical protein